VVFPHGGDRYLVASYGVVNWVRNLRAAEQAGPILRFSLHTGPPGIPRPIVAIFRRFFVLPYLDVDMTSSVHDFVRSARHHPVFLVQGRGSDTSPQ
jgi:hypothetical protein